MLIRWGYSDDVREHLDNARFAEFVRELLRAHRRGSHLVVIDRLMVELLREVADLSASDRATLERLSQEYTQTGAVHNKASVYLSVICSMAQAAQVDGHRIDLTIGTFLNSKILDVPVLLVENISTDGWVLSTIIRSLGRLLGHPSVQFEVHHGGGDAIANVMGVLLSEERAVVAVVDSDKNAPCSPPSGKLARLVGKMEESDWPISAALEMPCREIENMVPIEALRRIASALTSPLPEILMEIQRRETKDGDGFYCYANMKDGYSSSALLKLLPNEREWLASRLELAMAIPEDEWNVPGLGNRVVEQLLSNGKYISEMVKAIKASAWRKIFEDFIAKICWYVVGARRVVT